MHQWGRALAATGAGPEAAEKLERALELYRRHGAGEARTSRVEADLRGAAAGRLI